MSQKEAHGHEGPKPSHDDHAQAAHHSEGTHGHSAGHHHRKHYETADGTKYPPIVHEALKIPVRERGRCKDLYVQYELCFRSLSVLEQLFHPKSGKCEDLLDRLVRCRQLEYLHSNSTHVSNVFYTNAAKAKAEGFSNTYAGEFHRDSVIRMD
eukprot:TRINITY_DN662_c0_g2_i7.p1 TRINITY_DN662_c0_g2~~TRINITY_DN662_c0_g2_i7.p1  ORF type:complete len:153 (+),score=14.42 TRINITY_DN662_c0_g2_i7:49-507(+)